MLPAFPRLHPPSGLPGLVLVDPRKHRRACFRAVLYGYSHARIGDYCERRVIIWCMRVFAFERSNRCNINNVNDSATSLILDTRQLCWMPGVTLGGLWVILCHSGPRLDPSGRPRLDLPMFICSFYLEEAQGRIAVLVKHETNLRLKHVRAASSISPKISSATNAASNRNSNVTYLI